MRHPPELEKAAQTKANEIATAPGFDPQKDIVLLAAVNSEAGFKKAVSIGNSLEKQYGKVGEVDLYSHAGSRDGPNFNYGHNQPGEPKRYSNEQAPARLLALKINWQSSDAKAGFYGCNTATFAQQFANRQRVTTFGFNTTTQFSDTPQGRSVGLYLFGSGGYSSVYMIHRDGRPPIRRDPTQPE